MIEDLVAEVEVGAIYEGPIVKMMDLVLSFRYYLVNKAWFMFLKSLKNVLKIFMST